MQAAGSGVVPHGIDASLQLLTAPGAIPTLAPDVILDGLSTYSNAAALNSALHAAGVGDINLSDTGLVITGVVEHVLVAYGTGSGVNIADVELVNTSGATQTADTANAALSVTALDLVSLTGTTALGDLVGHNIHFV